MCSKDDRFPFAAEVFKPDRHPFPREERRRLGGSEQPLPFDLYFVKDLSGRSFLYRNFDHFYLCAWAALSPDGVLDPSERRPPTTTNFQAQSSEPKKPRRNM